MSWQVGISMISIFIAICALLTAVWSSWAQRQHNKLSLKPIIALEGDDERLTITNHGLGPAIIEKVELATRTQRFELSRAPLQIANRSRFGSFIITAIQ